MTDVHIFFCISLDIEFQLQVIKLELVLDSGMQKDLLL